MKTLVVRGQYVAPVTPFNRSGEVMDDAFARLIAWHLECGVDGFLIAGDNGEAWALSPAELGAITATAVKLARGRAPVFVGTSAITAKQTIALSDIAAANGADGLCLTPQFYVLNGSKAEVVRRFELVAKAVPLPVMAYNNPARTGVVLSPEILDAVCGVAPVVALKEATRDFVHISRVLEMFTGRIGVLAGAAEYILPCLELGADGYLSTAPEMYGADAARLLAVKTMPLDEKRRWHFRITKVFQALMGTGTRPAAYKAALNMIGLPAGFPREPVQPLTPAEEEKVRSVLVECGVLERPALRKAAS